MDFSSSANPLILDSARDTLAALRSYLRYLLDLKAQDADAHPGERLALAVMLPALDHLIEIKN